MVGRILYNTPSAFKDWTAVHLSPLRLSNIFFKRWPNSWLFGKVQFLAWRRGGRDDSLSTFRLFGDQEGAERYPGQDVALLDPGPLRQSFVAAVSVQAYGVLLAIKAADGAIPILRVLDQRSPLQTKRTGSPVGLTFPALGCLQAVELAAVQLERDDVPQTAAGQSRCSADGGCQYPGINSAPHPPPENASQRDHFLSNLGTSTLYNWRRRASALLPSIM